MTRKSHYTREQQSPVIVMAFGTFDFFHDGHSYYLQQAKAMGDQLIVVIARDRTVSQIKGEAPVNHERKRLKTVKSKGIADKVILGYHKNKHKVVSKYKPDIIALGYDQYVFTQTLKKTLIDLKLNTVIKRVEAHFPQIFKSSLIKTALREQEDERQQPAGQTEDEGKTDIINQNINLNR